MRLQEQIQEMKRLMTEATSTSSSGSYETPMGFDEPVETGEVIGVEIMDDAPDVEVVDVTASDDMGHEGQSCGETHPDMSHEEWGDEDGDVDLTDIFNSLGLFTETTIKEQDDEDPPRPDTNPTKEDEDWTGTTQDDMEKPILIQNLPFLAKNLEIMLSLVKKDIKKCEDGCNDIEVAKHLKDRFNFNLTRIWGMDMKTIDTVNQSRAFTGDVKPPTPA